MASKEILFKDLQEGQKFILGKATFTKGRHGSVQGGWSGSSWRFVDGNKVVKVKSEGLL
jgi:hypothetical protein